jgi:hypothetical protein
MRWNICALCDDALPRSGRGVVHSIGLLFFVHVFVLVFYLLHLALFHSCCSIAVRLPFPARCILEIVQFSRQFAVLNFNGYRL